MKIVTGRTGIPHVTSEDIRAYNIGVLGMGDYVLNTNGKLSYSIIDHNTIRISDGDLVMQGTHSRIDTGKFVDVTIQNGEIGYNRIDLIVARYEVSNGIESVTLEVIEGEKSTGVPAAPGLTTGNILAGDSTHEMLLYTVTINGINAPTVTKGFTLIEAIAEKVNSLVELYNESVPGGNITIKRSCNNVTIDFSEYECVGTAVIHSDIRPSSIVHGVVCDTVTNSFVNVSIGTDGVIKIKNERMETLDNATITGSLTYVI